MTRYDIPFSSDDTHRFLPWLIGLMVGMAALLLCMGASINSWVVDSHGSYTNSFTVDIPAQGEGGDAKLVKVQEAIQKLKGVTAIARLGDERMREMLSPWFGSGEVVQDLPLPIVLDVRLDNKAPAPNYAALQKELSAIVEGTQVDAREKWVASFSQFSGALQALVSALAMTIVIVMSVTISFASRASLQLHGRTVGLLHSMGAEDQYIASQFQREAFLLTMRGALIGCAFAGLLYLIAGQYVASLQVATLPTLKMNVSHYLLLLFMPFGCGLVAWCAAYVTVRHQLQKVL